MAITKYKGLMVPTLADATAITTSTTTQELDPAGAMVINLTCTSGSDLASLPDPQPYISKTTDSNGRNRTPKVIPGQLLKLELVTDGGGSLAISYKNVLGAAKTATTVDANDTLLLVATDLGYAILENTGFAIS